VVLDVDRESCRRSGGSKRFGSGSLIVTMMQPAEPILRKDAARGCGANSIVGGSPSPRCRSMFKLSFALKSPQL
jgi:hypothetical protein